MPRTATPKAPATDHPVLGRLPVGWKAVRLRDVVEKVGSGVTPRGGEKVYLKEGVPFVRSQNIGWGEVLLDDLAFVAPAMHNEMRTTELVLNDVLLNISGASIGRAALVNGKLTGGNVNQHVCIIRTKHDELDPAYMLAFLLSHNGQKQIDSFQAGGNREGLNYNQIRTFWIPLPPLPEQRRIARILGTWDKAIGLLGQQIAAKEERLRGLIDQLVSGARHGAEGNKLPKGWRWKTLGELGSFTKGKGILKADINTEGVPAITYGELYTVHHVRIKRFYSFVNDEVANASQPIQYNDVLFAGSGETAEEIGKAAVYLGRERACAGGDVIILRPKDVNALYLATALNSSIADRQRLKFGQGHSVVHIYPSQLAELKVPLPPAEIQDFIASATTALDDELDLLRTKLAQLHEQKRGLVQRLLAGDNTNKC